MTNKHIKKVRKFLEENAIKLDGVDEYKMNTRYGELWIRLDDCAERDVPSIFSRFIEARNNNPLIKGFTTKMNFHGNFELSGAYNIFYTIKI